MTNLQFIIQVIILVYFIGINSIYSLLTFFAFFEVRKQYRRSCIDDYNYLYRSKLTPGVSLLIPAYNEEATIINSVKSHLQTKYPDFEVIVINDGSKDKTFEVLKKEFNLTGIYHVMYTGIKTKEIKSYYVSLTHPKLVVIDKVNGGKADALNVGINASKHSYFISLDADVILEKDSILRIMKPIAENPDQYIAAGGIVRIANGCVEEKGEIKEVRISQKPLVIFQIIEYLRAFTAGRAGFSQLNSLLIVSGAFGVFNVDEARKIGGYESESVGEDMELLVKFHRNLRRKKRKYNILYCAYPVCWTEVPENLEILGRQRNRWQRGLCDVLKRHKRMLFNPHYGRIGLFALPFFFIFEFLGPFIELFGYLYLIFLVIFGFINWPFFLLFMALAVEWSILLSVSAILFEDLNFKWYKKWQYIAKLLFFAILENFGYRQITAFWRIQGSIDYFRGKKSWGEMPRKGFGRAAAMVFLLFFLLLFSFPVCAEEKISLDYTYEYFDKTYDPWQMTSLEFFKGMPFGSLIGRINHASRFNLSGQQFEVDAYPIITKDMYAYLNVGYSSFLNLFPESHFGGEIYKSVPNALEASLGFRQLNFRRQFELLPINVTIYTGSIGKYIMDYWFSYRHYYTTGISNSGYISIRKYFSDSDNFLTFKIGFGTFPDEAVSTFAIYQLNSQSINLDFQRKVNSYLIVKGIAGIEQEEINLGNYRYRTTLGIGIKISK